MESIALLVAYVAIAVFVVAVVARFLVWQRMPLHLRWELYPVAHEGKRAAYGGSYLEDTDWWKKPRHQSLWGELKVMVPEILFLVALKEHNPKQWIRSFPFHFGLYMVTGATVLMVLGVCFGIAPGIAGAPGAGGATGIGLCFHYGIVVLGAGGAALALLGALGLLQRRLGDPEYRDFSAPADILNLVFFVAAFGLALAHFVLIDLEFIRVREFVARLVTFNQATGLAPVGGLTAISVMALAVLMAYIPLTHMSHFVGKFFAYHAIRWGDEPNLRGSAFEETIQAQLKQPVSWSAPHIRGDGKKNWVDVATEKAEP